MECHRRRNKLGHCSRKTGVEPTKETERTQPNVEQYAVEERVCCRGSNALHLQLWTGWTGQTNAIAASCGLKYTRRS